MTATEHDAIEAARSFLSSRHHRPWSEETLRVDRDVVEDRDTWIVRAIDELPPGDEEWMHLDRPPVLYFVEVATGRLFGFQAGSNRTIFG